MTSKTQNGAPRRKSGSRTGGTGRAGRYEGTGAQRALGWAALAVILAAALWNGAYVPVAWVLLSASIFVLFAVQVVLDFRYGVPTHARRAAWLALPYFAVLVWLLIQARSGAGPGLAHPFWTFAPDGASPSISAYPDAGWRIVMRFSCYALCFWILLRGALASKHGGMEFIQAIALFSLALALYGLLAYSLGSNVLLGVEDGETLVRASFWNRNTYATFAVFGVLANVTAYLHKISGNAAREGMVALRDFIEQFFAGAWIYAFGALVGLAAVAMTLSRGGAAAGIVGMVVLIWAVRRGDARINLAVLAIPAVVFGFALLFMSSGVVDRISETGRQARLPLFEATWTGILDRPVLGHGAGAYLEAFRPYAPPEFSFVEWHSAHNSYLENAFEFGLPAAVVLYLVLAAIGWRLWRGVRIRRRHQSIPAFALACFAVAAVHALTDFSFHYPAVAGLFSAILGIGWAQSFQTRGSGDSRRKADHG